MTKFTLGTLAGAFLALLVLGLIEGGWNVRLGH